MSKSTTKEKINTPKTLMSISVNRNLLEQFRVYTQKNHRKMSNVLEQSMQRYVNNYQ